MTKHRKSSISKSIQLIGCLWLLAGSEFRQHHDSSEMARVFIWRSEDGGNNLEKAVEGFSED